MRHFARVSLGGLLLAALTLAGCAAASKTGEVGNKNLRPYQANDHEKHGLPLNGVHSYDSPTYRLKSADSTYNHQDKWMLRNRMGNNLIGAHGNDQLEMDGKLAGKLEALPGVKKAYVLLAGNQAYVGMEENRHDRMNAATTESGTDVKPALIDRIAGQIQSAFPNVHQVYVTSNPEYLARMKVYSDAAYSGHSVKEYLAEFNALAARIFPAVSYRGNSSGHSGARP